MGGGVGGRGGLRARADPHPSRRPPQNVTHQFDRLLADPRVTFWGGVDVGGGGAGAVGVGSLRAAFDAVVLAHGADAAPSLPIPGASSLPGVLTARSFVLWANGHPDGRELGVDLGAVSSVAVVGVGNVALDCARLLLADPAALARTDISRRALTALQGSAVRRVTLVARRGAAAAACTAKEVREVLSLPSVAVTVTPPPPLDPTKDDIAEMGGARGRKRVYDLLAAAAAAGPRADATKSLHLQFLRSPLEFTPDDADPGRVGGVTLAVNEVKRDGGRTRAAPTGATERLPAGLVLQAVGFRTPRLAETPYDETRAVVPSGLGGRVEEGGGDENAAPSSSPSPAPLYVTGWARRGPSGIIGTNLIDASDVAAAVAADAAARPLGPARPGRAALKTALAGAPIVDAAGWRAIDAAERKAGEAAGAVRVKLETRGELFAAAAASRA